MRHRDVKSYSSLVVAVLLLVIFATFVIEHVSAHPALDLINEARLENGLPILQFEPHLQSAAENHSRYLAVNNTSGHTEEAGLPGYTGERCLERVLSSGYPLRFCVESLSVGQANWEESVADLMGALYHRIGFLRFDTDEIGIAYDECRSPANNAEDGDSDDDGVRQFYSYVLGNSHRRKQCEAPSSPWGVRGVCRDKSHQQPKNDYDRNMKVVADQSSDVAVYPWSGQHNVRPGMRNNERPNPLPGVEVISQPVSMHFNPERFKNRSITFDYFILRGPDGNDISLMPRRDHSNDDEFSEYDFAWYPKAPLVWGGRYQVLAGYRIDGQFKRQEWSFTTADVPCTHDFCRGGFKQVEISRRSSVLHLRRGQTTLITLSPRLGDSAIKSIQTHYQNNCQVKIEAFNTIGINMDGPGKLLIQLGAEKGNEVLVEVLID